MGLSSLSLVRQVTAQIQGKHSLENTSTEPVEKSADAVIELERVKKEHEAQVRISQLEAEAQEIELMAGGLDELQGATEEVNELKEAVESRLEMGGLTRGEAQFALMSLNRISSRVGLECAVASVESFSGSIQDRIDLTHGVVASLEGVIGDAWKTIKELFKNLWNKIKGWFTNVERSAEATKEKTEEVAKKVEEAEAEEVTIPGDEPVAEQIVLALGVSESAEKEVKVDTPSGSKDLTVVPQDAPKPTSNTNELFKVIPNTTKFLEDFKKHVIVGSVGFIEKVKTDSSASYGEVLDKMTMNKKEIEGGTLWVSPLLLGGAFATISFYNDGKNVAVHGAMNNIDLRAKGNKAVLNELTIHKKDSLSAISHIRALAIQISDLVKQGNNTRDKIDKAMDGDIPDGDDKSIKLKLIKDVGILATTGSIITHISKILANADNQLSALDKSFRSEKYVHKK